MPKLRLIFVFVFAVVATSCVIAQESPFPEHFGKWQPQDKPPLVLWPRPPEREKYDNNPPYTAMLAESGVVRVEERYYRSGDLQTAVRMYKLRDPSSAYEVYTSQINPQMSASTVGGKISNTAIDSDHLIVQTGEYVLAVASPRIVSAGDLQELIEIFHKNSDKTPLPNIRTFLPEEGKIDGSQRYAPGPQSFRMALQTLRAENYGFLEREIGFDPSADVETMLAQYRYKNNEGAVLLALYPTPQIAEQRLRHINQVLATNGKSDTTFQRRGSLLFAALNTSSTRYADVLRNNVQYGTSVTWNEGKHELTDPPITSTVVKIIIATGVFMLVAIVLGIAFGGVRIVIKRLFPGKVFDRPQDIEVLQMGLSGKKIDPTDFY